MTIFRPAFEAELRSVYEVFYQNELLDSPHLPLPGDIPPYLHHVLQTGTLYVAEQDGKILAFAGAITRGNISFLTDLFVLPSQQSGQLGKTLLRCVMPQDDLVHCTMSSSDPRALALYIRAGMRPQWPHFALRLEKPRYKMPTAPDVEIIEADPGDPALVQWDAQISGRLRPVDHQFWVREEQALPLWFRRQGHIVGYGYVRLGTGSLNDPQTCTLGPIGTSIPEDATACVLAAVNFALQKAEVLHIDVPGPHPCLAPVLATWDIRSNKGALTIGFIHVFSSLLQHYHCVSEIKMTDLWIVQICLVCSLLYLMDVVHQARRYGSFDMLV